MTLPIWAEMGISPTYFLLETNKRLKGVALECLLLKKRWELSMNSRCPLQSPSNMLFINSDTSGQVGMMTFSPLVLALSKTGQGLLPLGQESNRAMISLKWSAFSAFHKACWYSIHQLSTRRATRHLKNPSSKLLTFLRKRASTFEGFFIWLYSFEPSITLDSINSDSCHRRLISSYSYFYELPINSLAYPSIPGSQRIVSGDSLAKLWRTFNPPTLSIVVIVNPSCNTRATSITAR